MPWLEYSLRGLYSSNGEVTDKEHLPNHEEDCKYAVDYSAAIAATIHYSAKWMQKLEIYISVN